MVLIKLNGNIIGSNMLKTISVVYPNCSFNIKTFSGIIKIRRAIVAIIPDFTKLFLFLKYIIPKIRVNTALAKKSATGPKILFALKNKYNKSFKKQTDTPARGPNKAAASIDITSLGSNLR